MEIRTSCRRAINASNRDVVGITACHAINVGGTLSIVAKRLACSESVKIIEGETTNSTGLSLRSCGKEKTLHSVLGDGVRSKLEGVTWRRRRSRSRCNIHTIDSSIFIVLAVVGIIETKRRRVRKLAVGEGSSSGRTV